MKFLFIVLSLILSMAFVLKSDKKTEVKEDTFKPKDIISLIDSLYHLLPEDGFYYREIDDFKKTHTNDKYGLLALDLKHATHYSGYATFDFLRFEDSTYAQKAFNELVGYYKQIYEAHYRWEEIEKLKTKSGVELVYSVFHKGGITYILKDNYIISHDRKCNYEYTIQNPREDYLVEKLYPKGKPTHHYFIRDCCGCPDNLSHELK